MPSLLSDEHVGGRHTRAEVQLDRLADNITVLKECIGPQVELAVVVKADGYGHGAPAVAHTALRHGAGRVVVYTLAEAGALRRAGFQGPVLVLGPFDPVRAYDCVHYRATPTVNCPQQAEELSRWATAAAIDLPYHVEIDTGLTRYGLLPEEVVPFVRRVSSLAGLHREGVFTHFARADERDKQATLQQFELFRRTCADLKRHGLGFPIRHVASSAAVLDLPDLRLNMVRVGIAAYGYYPSDEVSRSVALQPVLALGSYVARLRAVPAGSGVSYGDEFRTTRPSLIGLVPFGYADGMPRSVQGKGQMLVRGIRAPIVGRVAMDQCMIDLTDVPDAREGDGVVILGRSGDCQIDAGDVGKWAGTISYEILVGIGARVPRVYIQNGGVLAVRPAMSSTVEPGLSEWPATT